ncbi:MAG: RNA-binding S4 domain-containing protein [Pseudorhodobacter sp.]|nr:RNA-binding S4 domain-containing protein [Pseudorhodobacter sp.]
MIKARSSPGANPAAAPRLTQRLDQWLWQTRFFKTRALATDQVTSRHVRLNGQKVLKPGHAIGPGDTLSFLQGHRVRLIRVLGLAQRRGSAQEAQALYLDLDATPAAPSPLE